MRYFENGRHSVYLDFSITSLLEPTLRLKPHRARVMADLQHLLRSSLGHEVDEEVLVRDVLDSDCLSLAHDGDQLLGLCATRRFSGLKVSGASHDVIVLQSLLVRPSFRRYGIGTKLLLSAHLEPWRTSGSGRPFRFSRVQVVARTQSRDILEMGRRIFSGLVGPGHQPSAHHQSMIDAAASKMGWRLDDWNLQSNVYAEPLCDRLLSGLRGHESFTFAGELRVATVLRLYAMLSLAYPWRYRRSLLTPQPLSLPGEGMAVAAPLRRTAGSAGIAMEAPAKRNLLSDERIIGVAATLASRVQGSGDSATELEYEQESYDI